MHTPEPSPHPSSRRRPRLTATAAVLGIAAVAVWAGYWQGNRAAVTADLDLAALTARTPENLALAADWTRAADLRRFAAVTQLAAAGDQATAADLAEPDGQVVCAPVVGTSCVLVSDDVLLWPLQAPTWARRAALPDGRCDDPDPATAQTCVAEVLTFDSHGVDAPLLAAHADALTAGAAVTS